MRPLCSLVPRGVLLVVVGLVAGCGGKHTVTGKVTRGGQPIAWQTESNLLLVHFAPVDRKNNTSLFTAETDTAAATYVIKNVPSGKYLVAVHLLDPSPKIDALSFAYNLVNSPLQFEVTGDAEYNIDLPLDAPRAPKSPYPTSKEKEE
jgi:hypothetical protein